MHFKRLTVFAVAALAGCGGGDAPVSPDVRAARLSFASEVAPEDREWILAAVEQARPEAQALIDDVDGMVVVSTFSDPGARAVGLMTTNEPGAYSVRFNLAYLNGRRKIDRDSTVIHELGHVIDHA